jgi:hypothetical protein
MVWSNPAVSSSARGRRFSYFVIIPGLSKAQSSRPKRRTVLGHHGLDLSFLRHIGSQEKRLAASGLDQTERLTHGTLIDVGDGNLGAVLGEGGCDGSPNPRGGAGDEDNLSIEIEAATVW